MCFNLKLKLTHTDAKLLVATPGIVRIGIHIFFFHHCNLFSLCVPLEQPHKFLLPPAILFPLERIAFTPLGYVRINLLEPKEVFQKYLLYLDLNKKGFYARLQTIYSTIRAKS